VRPRLQKGQGKNGPCPRNKKHGTQKSRTNKRGEPKKKRRRHKRKKSKKDFMAEPTKKGHAADRENLPHSSKKKGRKMGQSNSGKGAEKRTHKCII